MNRSKKLHISNWLHEVIQKLLWPCLQFKYKLKSQKIGEKDENLRVLLTPQGRANLNFLIEERYHDLSGMHFDCSIQFNFGKSIETWKMDRFIMMHNESICLNMTNEKLYACLVFMYTFI